jgi:inner membrane protein
MDTITHIVLGACVGEAVLGQKVGKKALIAGAIAQTIPDIDFVSALWLTPAEQLLAHRGITHSFLFIAVFSPVVAITFRRLFFSQTKFSLVLFLILLELIIHVFLDAFNNYGVGWFEPFANYRLSFNAVYVVDILMLSVPLLSFTALIMLSAFNKNRKIWSTLGIGWIFLYLCVSIYNKSLIDSQTEKILAENNIAHYTLLTTPAPLQNMLWMIVAGDGKGYNIAYRSVFDDNSHPTFVYFPANGHLLDTLSDHGEIGLLKQFSQGYYTVEKWGDTLVFNDLRFGQIIGWDDPKERFVFHYFLRHDADNRLVVQRGRFAKWDRKSITSFIRRIEGD